MITADRLLSTLTVAALFACTPAASARAGAHAAIDDSTVQLAGKGPRREALTALQFTAFDQGLWGKLAGWSEGAPLTAEQVKGKPVLIVSWASWFRASQNGLKFAREVAARYEPLGLVVVAVHAQRGFDKAGAVIDEQKIAVRYAHDEAGAFFAALRIDGAGPDYYLIDRAGRIRFAAVARDSLDDAAAIVSKETPVEAAKALPPAPGAGAPKKEGGAGAGGGKSDEFRQPAAAYANIKWPAKNAGQFSAKDVQGKAFPAEFGKEKYLGLVPDRTGKIVVLDFWATWCPPCKVAIPHLEKLAEKYEKDAVVIGITQEDEPTLKKFLEKGRHQYFQALDVKGTMNSAMGIQGIPHVVVISTDGVVRWQGNPHPNQDLQSLQAVVAELVRIDPGVKARQTKGGAKAAAPSGSAPGENQPAPYR